MSKKKSEAKFFFFATIATVIMFAIFIIISFVAISGEPPRLDAYNICRWLGLALALISLALFCRGLREVLTKKRGAIKAMPLLI